ncbi:hypothetical protein [Ramlibacter montanisoli]|uniref:Uncharacterized protein n=1 Tax=Ramlibacter montanisoli TaxID=2732512 RepID=A0A849K7J4_9BURK|nr:hypothetical protein [Ramlibacter montanisoli]NNU42017.1 hypothetical protein [Ramlibacter montanisoli]
MSTFAGGERRAAWVESAEFHPAQEPMDLFTFANNAAPGVLPRWQQIFVAPALFHAVDTA